MAYSDFTLVEVTRKFGLIIDESAELFPQPPVIATSSWLKETLNETLPLVLAVHTEKIRSELLIAPVLVEVRKLADREISFFSGVEFSVDPSEGLTGICDYIISRSPEQLFIAAPVVIIVEAKNENIKGGLAQCMAAMVAAQRFNARDGKPGTTVYGAVTSGTTWRFLRLAGNNVQIAPREVYIDDVERIVGTLLFMAQDLQALVVA
jgi:hypothetical protein